MPVYGYICVYMSLSATNLSIESLLALMEHQQPESINLNHVLVGDSGADWIPRTTHQTIPEFTVIFSGFVEVDFFMGAGEKVVDAICIRQSAMSFSELEQNGSVLPTLGIECERLHPLERKRLNTFATRYIEMGKVYDAEKGAAILTQYIDKAMFSHTKYGSLSRA